MKSFIYLIVACFVTAFFGIVAGVLAVLLGALLLTLEHFHNAGKL